MLLMFFFQWYMAATIIQYAHSEIPFEGFYLDSTLDTDDEDNIQK
jgi:hypothetical protein